MKNIILIGLFFTFSFQIQAQDCKAYIPQEVGTITEISDYNKKGKLEGVLTQNLKSISTSSDTIIYNIQQTHTDKKGKEDYNNELKYKCFNNVFYIDMNAFVSQEQMEAYKDMDVKMTMDEMEIPADLSAGQKLKDGTINIQISSADLPMTINMNIHIKDRKVEGNEEITTEAGTFQTIKISQTTEMKTIMTMRIKTIIWYAIGVGTVKTETYKENGSLVGTSRITKITKP